MSARSVAPLLVSIFSLGCTLGAPSPNEVVKLSDNVEFPPNVVQVPAGCQNDDVLAWTEGQIVCTPNSETPEGVVRTPDPCDVDQVLVRVGNAFECRPTGSLIPEDVVRTPESCSDDQVLVRSGSDFVCMAYLPTDVVRVSSCADGSVPKWNQANGEWSCLPDESGESPWQANASDIFYVGGRVGLLEPNPVVGVQVGWQSDRSQNPAPNPMGGMCPGNSTQCVCPAGTYWLDDPMNLNGQVEDGECEVAAFVVNDSNVGIGTTSPKAGLHLRFGEPTDPNRQHRMIIESNANAQGPGIEFLTTNNGSWTIGSIEGANELSIQRDVRLNQNPIMKLRDRFPFAQPRVGINVNDLDDANATFQIFTGGGEDAGFVVTSTETPSELFRVDRDGCISYIGGQLGTCTSDRALKTGIRDVSFPNAAERIAKLRPRKYRYKANQDADRYGLIAQEVEAAVPELAKTDSNGRKTVDYEGVKWMMLKALQEQQAIIERLERSNHELAKRVRTLEEEATRCLLAGSTDRGTCLQGGATQGAANKPQ